MHAYAFYEQSKLKSPAVVEDEVRKSCKVWLLSTNRMTVCGDRRYLTFSLSLSAFALGVAFGPSDCWIRSSFFFCRETTYYLKDTISEVKYVSEV